MAVSPAASLTAVKQQRAAAREHLLAQGQRLRRRSEVIRAILVLRERIASQPEVIRAIVSD